MNGYEGILDALALIRACRAGDAPGIRATIANCDPLDTILYLAGCVTTLLAALPPGEAEAWLETQQAEAINRITAKE